MVNDKGCCAGRVEINFAEVVQNVVIGLTVSFVALSLGAALGILSGRGAFAGMISAGIIAFICSAFGGTRVQCSGPTAPMSALTATVVAFAREQATLALPGINPDHFIFAVLFLTALIMILMGVLRLGKYIRMVPNVIISGFMSGIALLIWLDQVKTVFGLGGKEALAGPIALNFAVATGTVALVFVLPPLLKKRIPALARFLPATLLAIIIMTLVANAAALPIAHVQLGNKIHGLGDLMSLFSGQWPAIWSSALVLAALPLALQLAMLGYLDTLLTSLVIDKMTAEPTRHDKELLAQGLANGSVAFLGGIPGAQATIRSVLMVRENATLRLAGIMVGVFVLLEIILFQDLIVLIPKAVFVGVLIKVGYDVFDFQPLRLYARELSLFGTQLFSNFFSRHDDEPIFVTNREVLMIIGTAVVTVVYGLNTAVGGFTVLFYFHNKIFFKSNPMRDLLPVLETEGVARED